MNTNYLAEGQLVTLWVCFENFLNHVSSQDEPLLVWFRAIVSIRRWHASAAKIIGR
jgi:hypothetical protein